MLDTDVTIDCTFESVPDGVGEIGDLGNLNVSNIEVDETSIIIKSVSEDNLGVYQCTANNTVAGQRVVASISIELVEGGMYLISLAVILVQVT